MEQPKITTTPGKYAYSAPAKPTKDGDRGSMIVGGERVEGAVSIRAIKTERDE